MKDAKSAPMKNARQFAKKQGGQVFYSGNVTKHHIKSNGKDERILIITNLFISYHSKKGENTNTNYWIDLKSINVQKKEKNTLIKLEFDQNELMTFEYPTKSKIDTILLETIKYMTTRQSISIEGVEAPTNFTLLPRSIFNIFLSQVLLNNNNLPKPLKSSIRMICRLHSKVVGFIPEMIGQYFPFLLKAIANSNYVESFRIPELSNNDVYGCLSEFLKSNKYELSSIMHLQISKQDMKKFSTFCDSFSKGKAPNNRISALTFSNTEFDQESIKALSESIINSKWNGGFEINSIKFDNAVKEDVNFVDSFFPNAASIQSSNSPIKLFSLNRMRIADVSQFISLMKGIRVLSLSYMGIEISTVFQAISNSGLDDLSFLNLSGNFLNETTNYVKKLPPTLQRLDMNEVDFLVKSADSEKGNTLVDFFLSILKKKWKSFFYLSFSHIFCHNNNEGPFPPEKALEFLFTKLKKCQNSSCKILKGLSFSCNFINDDFFEFIKKCTNLKSLYLDFCLDSKSPCLDSFCDSLENSLPNLNVLSFKGDVVQNRVIGDFFPTLCKSLKKCKSLNCIIASDNLIGVKGLQALSKLFDPVVKGEKENEQKKDEDQENEEDKNDSSEKDEKNYLYDTITSICFDNCNAPSLMPIIGVVVKASKLKRSILIDYPTQEVWRLKQANIAEKQQIRELRERIELAYIKSPTMANANEIDRPSRVKSDSELKPITQYWTKPFAEYKVQVNDFFPEYLSPEVANEIYSPVLANISDNGDEDNEDESSDSSEDKKKKKKSDENEDDEIVQKKSKNKKNKNDDESEEESESDMKKKKKKKAINDEDDESSDDDNIRKKKKSTNKKRKSSLESESDDDDDENIKKKKKSTNKKRQSNLESESDDDDDEIMKKKKKSTNKKRKSNLESESDDDDEIMKKKKKSTSKKRKSNLESESDDDDDEDIKKKKKSVKKKQKLDSESEEEDKSDDIKKTKKKKKNSIESESESENNGSFKKKKKRSKVISESDSEGEKESDDDNNQRKKTKLKRKSSKKIFSESDSDSDENDRPIKRKNSIKNKKSSNKRQDDSDSDFDDEDFDLMKSRKRTKKPVKMDESNDDEDDEENQSFPLSIDSKKEKKIVNNLKKKFSINRLKDEIVNN